VKEETVAVNCSLDDSRLTTVDIRDFTVSERSIAKNTAIEISQTSNVEDSSFSSASIEVAKHGDPASRPVSPKEAKARPLPKPVEQRATLQQLTTSYSCLQIQ
jgi:hypothetical protein